MEPVQIGRGDYGMPGVANMPKDAAMEPVQIGRGDRLADAEIVGRIMAAMEPVQIGRGDRWRARRKVKPAGPQWSPSRSDGVTFAGAVIPI